MPRAGWLAVALLAIGFVSPIPVATAQPLGPLSPSDAPPLSSTPVSSNTRNNNPPPILGAPERISEAPTTWTVPKDPPAERKPQPQRAAKLGAPRAADSSNVTTSQPQPVSTEIIDSAIARTAYQPQQTDPVSDFLTARSELKSRETKPEIGDVMRSVSRQPDFGERFNNVIGIRNGNWFRSDHTFDGFISPVTNPFLFEDPRSLTEVRPLVLFQKIPSSQPDFYGGSITFFGTQARLALTDRWSLVLNKFGGINIDAGDGSRFGNDTGFAEIWFGPKWTFYRDEDACRVAAAGLQFQLPVGSQNAFQNTGALSLVPYVSYAQNFLRDFQWGSFNVMASTGFSFSTTKERSDYLYLSAHLDFDVANAHRFYPLAELNWFLVTSKGTSTPVGIEGRDLINFGGQASGTGLFTGAFGARYKFSERAQVGGAFEFPFAGRRDLFRYRFNIDFILRY